MGCRSVKMLYLGVFRVGHLEGWGRFCFVCCFFVPWKDGKGFRMWEKFWEGLLIEMLGG